MRFLVVAATILLSSVPAFAQDWSWINPRPQGHTLYDIVFLDNDTAIAAGECGTVLVTHDTGYTWSVASKLFTVTSYRAIERLDANTAVVVGDAGLSIRTTDQGATWTPIPTGAGATLVDVSFFDASHGIAVGGIVTARTSDGGLTWQKTNAPANLHAVDMTSSTDAIAVGDNGAVLRTTNGGMTWTSWTSPLSPPADATLMAVDFLDLLNGAVAATNGYDELGNFAPPRCWFTSDGGATWTSSNLNFGLTNMDYYPNELIYPQTAHVLIAARVVCCTTSAFDPPPFGHYASTVNAGASWSNSETAVAHGIARNNDGVVMVVGEHGSIVRRDPDGLLMGLGGGGPEVIQRSSFFDTGAGALMSSDGANFEYGSTGTVFTLLSNRSFRGVTTVSNRQCHDIAFLSATEVVAVGRAYYQGAVMRSTDAGKTWTTIWTGATPSALLAVGAGSATKAIAVGNGGTALIVENDIVTPVATGGANFSDIAFAGPGVVLAVGGTDARSIDGGLTWTPIAAPSTAVSALDFSTSTQAFGVDPSGLLRTDDIGATWTPVLVAPGLRDISFSDAQHGMAVGDQALVLITTDGGNTWAPSETPTTRNFTSVSLLEPDHAFVSGVNAIAFEFGDATVPTLIRSLDVDAVPFGAALRWDVVTDENLAGFAILRSGRTIADCMAPSTRSFRDEGLTPGATYEYQLLAIDRDGSYTQSMPVAVTIPRANVELLPNQPNPFNPSTTIRFVLPEKMAVRLTVHDVAGHVVATLVEGQRDPGVHSVQWTADGVASGIYFARLRAGKTELSRKLVLLK